VSRGRLDISLPSIYGLHGMLGSSRTRQPLPEPSCTSRLTKPIRRVDDDVAELL
jgi:hypothetical protein